MGCALALAWSSAAGATVSSPSHGVAWETSDRALPDPANGRTSAFLRVDVHGRDVAVADVGPTLWQSGDGGRSFTTDGFAGPKGCPRLVGPVDVAHASSDQLAVSQSCLFGALHWRGRPGAVNPTTAGFGTPIAANVDGGWLTASGRREWWVGHDLVGAGIASELLVARSDDGGTSWTVTWANAPTSQGVDHVAARIRDDGPNVFSPVAVDPTNPAHLAVVYSAESRQDLAQLHASDDTDRYEWDTGVYAATSSDGGRTWAGSTIVDTGQPDVGTDHEAYDDTAGWFPALTWAPDGTLYAAYAHHPARSTRWVVMVSRSRNGGRTWATPVAVSGSQQAFAPALAADDHGLVAAWFASDAPDDTAGSVEWRLTGARLRWRSDQREPRVTAGSLTGIVHTGPMLPIGPQAAHGWRSLDLALNEGDAWIPYARERRNGVERRLLCWRGASSASRGGRGCRG